MLGCSHQMGMIPRGVAVINGRRRARKLSFVVPPRYAQGAFYLMVKIIWKNRLWPNSNRSNERPWFALLLQTHQQHFFFIIICRKRNFKISLVELKLHGYESEGMMNGKDKTMK